MKKKLTIAAFVLAVSAVGGSVYAANGSNVDGTIKASNITSVASVSSTEPTVSTAPISAADAAKLDDSTNFAKIAKEKGITLEELFAQLEKEGKLFKTVSSTVAEETKATTTEGTAASEIIPASTLSTEVVDLEKMAKEKGITLEELIAQLEKEGKLTKATMTTEAVQAEKGSK